MCWHLWTSGQIHGLRVRSASDPLRTFPSRAAKQEKITGRADVLKILAPTSCLVVCIVGSPHPWTRNCFADIRFALRFHQRLRRYLLVHSFCLHAIGRRILSMPKMHKAFLRGQRSRFQHIHQKMSALRVAEMGARSALNYSGESMRRPC